MDSTPFISSAVQSILGKINSTPGEVRIALSGGSTPGPVYRALAEQDTVDWKRVQFFLADERYVPADDDKSNARLVQETLLSTGNIPAGCFHPFDTSLPIDQAVEGYEALLRQLPAPLFHLTILGMGPDGHTASLFPNDTILAEKERLVAHTTTEHFDIRDRLTLTLPAIHQSQSLMLLISGREKAALLDKLTSEKKPNPTYPISYLLNHPGMVVWKER